MRQWLGAYRYFYNRTVDYLKHNPALPWMTLGTNFCRDGPEWSRVIPYQVKKMAVKEAVEKFWETIKATKRLKQACSQSFKSRKELKQTIVIPSSALKGKTFYPRALGLFIKASEAMQSESDAKLTYDHGHWYLIVTRTVNVGENQADTIVAIDPGVKNFATVYSEHIAGKIGADAVERIIRLCKVLDQLYSKRTQAKAKKKRKLNKAINRILLRIEHLRDELHKKTAAFLTKNFKVILLPTFETQEMIVSLNSKVARRMATLSHFRFKTYLKFKAKMNGATVVDLSEAYTSRTCTRCGQQLTPESTRRMLCPSCGLTIDRDINGARNIFLRALGDPPA